MFFYLFDYALNSRRSLFFNLTKIFGLNRSRIHLLYKYIGCSKNSLYKSLISFKDLYCFYRLKRLLCNSFMIEKPLKRFYHKKLKDKFHKAGYHALRLRKGYPIRGQRTHTNASTAQKRLYTRFFDDYI